MAKTEKTFITQTGTFEISEDNVYIIYQGVKYKKVPERAVKEGQFDWTPMFEKLWSLYPRKVNKILAKKTFEHKVRGLPESECRAKCNQIYMIQMHWVKYWEENETELCYIKHYSSWLNAEIEDSSHYEGGKSL